MKMVLKVRILKQHWKDGSHDADNDDIAEMDLQGSIDLRVDRSTNLHILAVVPAFTG
jgi:hypothetical protein